jgi:hypothetical protein
LPNGQTKVPTFIFTLYIFTAVAQRYSDTAIFTPGKKKLEPAAATAAKSRQ